MIRLAFKIAAVAAAIEGGLGKLFSLEIARISGGTYSHVEIWLDGPPTSARCFSAREPDGTGFAVIDLSDPALWEIVTISDLYRSPSGALLQADKAGDYPWMQGRSGRRYNFTGIAGIALGRALTDPHDDFCSQCAFEFLQDRRGMFPDWNLRWSAEIAPSGFGKDGKRFGLYELLKGMQKLP